MWNKEFDIDYSKNELFLIEWLLANGFKDTSWHNDACPSFERGDMRIYLDFEQSLSDVGDFDGWTKYSAYHTIDDVEVNENKPSINTDSLVELMDFVNANK